MIIRLSFCLLLAILTGCQPLIQAERLTEAQAPTRLEPWLQQLATTMSFDQEQSEQAFKQFKKPIDQPFELYRYGLVNQQLGDRLGWIRARDSFRRLGQMSISPQVLPLVQLLERHNQDMINGDARQARVLEAVSQQQEQIVSLTNELRVKQDALANLQQQLKALKAVEEAISHKRAEPASSLEKSQ